MKRAKLTAPVEDKFYKYPVLRIPVARRTEELIIGLERAKAIMIHIDAIRQFVNKHIQEGSS